MRASKTYEPPVTNTQGGEGGSRVRGKLVHEFKEQKESHYMADMIKKKALKKKARPPSASYKQLLLTSLEGGVLNSPMAIPI